MGSVKLKLQLFSILCSTKITIVQKLDLKSATNTVQETELASMQLLTADLLRWST